MCENRILPLRFAHSLSGLWPRVSQSLGKYRPTATLGGGLGGRLGGGLLRGVFKQDLKGDLLSSSGQLMYRSGLVQVWFNLEVKLEVKFNSLELDSEVGRLVPVINPSKSNRKNYDFGLGSVIKFSFAKKKKFS